MDSAQRFIISLVKSALTGEKTEFTYKPDFDTITTVGKKHSITNLLYVGLEKSKLLSEYIIPESFSDKVSSNILISNKQEFYAEKMKSEFEKNGIDYMVLKGLNLKKLYPSSVMRSMSDIDILIRENQYEKVRDVLTKLSFTEGEESDHEHIWTGNKVYLEMHKRIIPSNNTDFIKYFGNGWDFAKKKSEKSYEYVMSCDDEYVFLFAHLSKHFRESGIGIKHFVDLWIYKNSFELNENYICDKLKILDLYDFYLNVLRTLKVWFENAQSDSITDYITDYVFKCGNFGTDENRTYAKALVASFESGSVESGKKKLFWRLVFPEFSHMKQKYPILNKAPVLLPAMYISRWFEAVFVKKGTVKHYKNELNAQTEENVNKYKQNLENIGLRYNLDTKEEKTNGKSN